MWFFRWRIVCLCSPVHVQLPTIIITAIRCFRFSFACCYFKMDYIKWFFSFCRHCSYHITRKVHEFFSLLLSLSVQNIPIELGIRAAAFFYCSAAHFAYNENWLKLFLSLIFCLSLPIKFCYKFEPLAHHALRAFYITP